MASRMVWLTRPLTGLAGPRGDRAVHRGLYMGGARGILGPSIPAACCTALFLPRGVGFSRPAASIRFGIAAEVTLNGCQGYSPCIIPLRPQSRNSWRRREEGGQNERENEGGE